MTNTDEAPNQPATVEDKPAQAKVRPRQTSLSEYDSRNIEDYPSDPELAEQVRSATGCEDPTAGAILVEQMALMHPDAPNTQQGYAEVAPTKAANKSRLLLAELEPEDGLQGLLAAEIVGCHNLAMTVMQGIQQSDFDPAHPGIRVAERLLRLTSRQVEVLGSLRRGGNQVVTVRREQVTVERHDDGSETTDRRTVEARGGRG